MDISLNQLDYRFSALDAIIDFCKNPKVLGQSLPFSKYIGPIGNGITILDGVIDLSNSIERNNKNLYYSTEEKILAAYMDMRYYSIKTVGMIIAGDQLIKLGVLGAGAILTSFGLVASIAFVCVFAIAAVLFLNYMGDIFDERHEKNKRKLFE